MIALENLTKSYGKQQVLHSLTLTMEPGKIYGFLGQNGAGKSTTMNLITGYIAPNEGTITIYEHDMVKEPEKAKKYIGYMPEIPPLYTDMTVYEYLMFCGELKGIPKRDRIFHVIQVMEKTKLEEVEDKLIKNLSKGFRQRVGLAQAILGDPKILILDEPTAGLDPVQVHEVRELIRDLGKEHTILLSSHILSEIDAVCDYVFMISKGKLVYQDSMEHLKEQGKSLEEMFLSFVDKEEEVC